MSEYKSVDPQRGIAFIPRRGINVSISATRACYFDKSRLIHPSQVHENEVMRAFKTVNDNYIEPISFTVPRRAETFQADIFPPAVGLRPAVSAKEWFDGKTGLPAKIDLESIYEGTAPKEVAADYQPPAAPVAPKVEPKKEEPKEEPKPVVRAPPPSVNDQKSSIAAMANRYQDADEEEPKKEEPSSFDEEVKPVQRNPLPIRTESKPATPPAASPAPAPVKPVSAATSSTPAPTTAGLASDGGATSLTEIKELIENQTKVITAQNDQIGLLTSEVESLKKRLGSGSQDQSERIRQLELELEEARS